jgi:transposase
MPQAEEFVGIDVSKRKLDWCLRGGVGGSTANTPDACKTLAEALADRGIKVAAMEASGGYERMVAAALRAAGITASIVDPKRVRRFAEAAGCQAKTDPIDAKMIAWFAATFPKNACVPVELDRERLAGLVGEREDFVAMRTQCLNRSEHGQAGLADQLRRELIEHLEGAIASLDAAIAEEIKAHEALAEDARLLTTAPGVGPQLAAGLLAWLPELGRLSDTKISALVGVAPYDDRSGGRDGARHIAGGRSRLRRLFYMATIGAATRHNPTLKAFYTRLRAKGKAAKVALVACMRKLVTILNTMMARREAWRTPQQPDQAIL